MYPLCGKLHADKKAFLCILFVVQVCLIGGVLLFSTFTSSNDTAANGSLSTGSSAANAFDARHDNPVPVVEFVHRNATRTSSDDSRHLNDDVRLVTSGRYDHEFVGRQHCFRVSLGRLCFICWLYNMLTLLLPLALSEPATRTDSPDARSPTTPLTDTAPHACASSTTMAAIAASRRCCGAPS